MNEFIVWDNLEEEWVDEEYIARYSGGVLFIADLDNEVVDLLHNENDKENRYIPFDCIGKTDINNKKIYADSSIVEYDFRYFKCDSYTKRKGFFTYDPNRVCYKLRGLENEGFLIDYLYGDDIKNIKIIDTIQENKLGLIK